MPYAYARFVGQGFRDWSILQGERQKSALSSFFDSFSHPQ